jgi:hypothetical protein
MPLFIFLNTQTMQIKSIVHSSYAVIALKTYCPGGLRTRVFCYLGRPNVHCATPPRANPTTSEFTTKTPAL